MSGTVQHTKPSNLGPLIFRFALFAAAASLALYIPFKYATQMHVMTGLYAFLFPLSGIVALSGMVLAIKPRISCDCGGMDAQTSIIVRAGVGAIALLWMVNGMLCMPTLAAMIKYSVWGTAFAAIHMTAQHIFLSLSVMAFAFAPYWMTRKLGVNTDDAAAPGKAANRTAPV